MSLVIGSRRTEPKWSFCFVFNRFRSIFARFDTMKYHKTMMLNEISVYSAKLS